MHRDFLDDINVNILTTWRLWIFEHPLVLLLLNLGFRLRVIYPNMHNDGQDQNVQCMRFKVQYDAWSRVFYLF
jgi:hypothetical protein